MLGRLSIDLSHFTLVRRFTTDNGQPWEQIPAERVTQAYKYDRLPLAAFPIITMASSTLHSRGTADALQSLVAFSARRLAVADQVALAKWDNGGVVEDPTREAMVIGNAVEMGKAKGLQPNEVSEFFKAQIEASKIIQYSLLADWHRGRLVPEHKPIDLAFSVRPELDRLQTLLIHQLAQIESIRARTTCHATVAQAIGRYLSLHYQGNDTLHAIALDRSLATVCAL